MLKVALNAHVELQAILINVQQHKTMWVVGGASATPKKLDLAGSATGKWDDKPDKPVDLDAMHYAESAPGKVMHVQFDSSS